MNIRKMKERVYDITQLEETPEYLSLISYFFLNTLEYLKGFMPLKEYRKVFEEACTDLSKDKSGYKVTEVLDSLLVATFYYKQTLGAYWWQQKTKRTFFNLSLLDSYDLLTDLFMQETGIEMDFGVDGSTLFEELALIGHLTSFPRQEIGKESCWMLSKLRENHLLKLESSLECALMRNKRSIFLGRYPMVKYLQSMGYVLSVILGISLFVAIARIAYNMCVEFPLLRLMSLENAGRAYDRRMVEVLLQSHSFLTNGIDVFGSRILFFCLAFMLVVGIEYVVEKLSDRI